MADEKNAKKPKAATAENSARYPLGDLISRSRELYGCPPEVVRGALVGIDQKEFTVDELRQLINKSQQRKVVI